MIWYLVIIFIGIVAGFLSLYRLPIVAKSKPLKKQLKVSVVIPVRNEAHSITGLITDLQKQNSLIDEIICIDDQSTDATVSIIESLKVTPMKIKEKPSDWSGKTYACHMGGLKATGDIIIFLDADVRLGQDAIKDLVNLYLENQHVISVQPYHKVSKFFEQFALFFNVIGLSGNGVATPHLKKRAGLFGPIIIMSKLQFNAIDGYTRVKDSVIEDVMLGQVFETESIKYDLFVGDEDISYVMYTDLKELVLGFTKNYASGASKASRISFLLTFLWVHTLTAIPLLLILGIITKSSFVIITASVFYCLVVIHLLSVIRCIGSFKRVFILFYPIPLIFFHTVFIYSIYVKIFKKQVYWKGREISLR